MGVEERLEALRPMLTSRQLEYIYARRECGSDIEAARKIECNPASVSRWKKMPAFAEAYELVTQPLALIRKEKVSPVIAQKKQELMSQQLDAVISVLPEIVQENVRLALNARSESTRLKAIQMLYDAVGFKAEEMMPVSKQSQVFVQMLTLMRPQIAAEVERRGLPVDVVEAEYDDADG